MRMVLTVQSARVYGKVINRGDEFDVPDKEARLWAALARAKAAKPAPYQTATTVAADEAEVDRRQRRRYNRRDMRAEE